MGSVKHRFFCPDITSGRLDEEESAHATRVLRLSSGDHIELLDGRGGKYLAVIRSAEKRTVAFEIISQTQDHLPAVKIAIAIAPTKNIDRFEFFMEKCTEVGISDIFPIITRNSERKELKTDKLRKNLQASIKQSGNTFLPELHEPVALSQFFKSDMLSDYQRFIAHCEDEASKIHLFNAIDPAKNVVILIGPEGDFTADEIDHAKQYGFIAVSLGESRLRTETAGIAACITCHLKNL